MGKEQLVAATVRGLLELALPLGSSLCDGAFDLFLYLQERASFAGEIHLVENDVHGLSEYGGLQRSSELIQHLMLAGHRLGADNVRAGDPGTFVVFEFQFSVSTLRPQPEGQRSDLGGAHVDVYAVEVVAQDQGRYGTPEVLPMRVLLPQGFPNVFIVVGFLIDSLQQVKAVEEKVARTAGRVQDPKLSRIFWCPVRDEDWRPQSLFLGEIVMFAQVHALAQDAHDGFDLVGQVIQRAFGEPIFAAEEKQQVQQLLGLELVRAISSQARQAVLDPLVAPFAESGHLIIRVHTVWLSDTTSGSGTSSP
jgi:hypothetical protein